MKLPQLFWRKNNTTKTAQRKWALRCLLSNAVRSTENMKIHSSICCRKYSSCLADSLFYSGDSFIYAFLSIQLGKNSGSEQRNMIKAVALNVSISLCFRYKIGGRFYKLKLRLTFLFFYFLFKLDSPTAHLYLFVNPPFIFVFIYLYAFNSDQGTTPILNTFFSSIIKFQYF